MLALLSQDVAADILIRKPQTPGGPVQMVETVVESVAGGKAQIRTSQGLMGVDLVLIQEVRKDPPAEWTRAREPIEKGDFATALPLVKAVADRFKGLPTQWAMDATSTLGNIYISLGKLGEAAATFDEFERAYSGAGFRVARVGKARVALEQGKFADAGQVALPVVADAMQKKSVSRAEGQLYGQAYYILGRVAESEGKFPEAMDFYCRTVAIFYQDRTIVKEAQNRIDELRKKGITVP